MSTEGTKPHQEVKIMSNIVFLITQHLGFLITTGFLKFTVRGNNPQLCRTPPSFRCQGHCSLSKQLNHKHSWLPTSHPEDPKRRP